MWARCLLDLNIICIHEGICLLHALTGYSSILLKDELDAIVKKGRTAGLPRWKDFLEDLQEGRTKFPSPRHPFLFTGMFMQCLLHTSLSYHSSAWNGCHTMQSVRSDPSVASIGLQRSKCVPTLHCMVIIVEDRADCFFVNSQQPWMRAILHLTTGIPSSEPAAA